MDPTKLQKIESYKKKREKVPRAIPFIQVNEQVKNRSLFIGKLLTCFLSYANS